MKHVVGLFYAIMNVPACCQYCELRELLSWVNFRVILFLVDTIFAVDDIYLIDNSGGMWPNFHSPFYNFLFFFKN